ncbi:hypothetical protein CP532_4157 [Ophiocordyceps camponoti-leonardi (nom. inval.)]|nr:hypothetical protein CP532_4157 [Ophiocordyceps camponoti-leonardi (nom. inval.)]
MSREQKYALVTGCGKGGIGEALVKQYVRQGVHAIATVLPSENSEHLTREGITWFPLDVTDENSVADLKQSILRLTGGSLDVLVNNALPGYTMTAIDTDVNSVKRMFDVNLFGPMQMVHYFHDMIIRTTGTIVNIGSIGGVVPYMYGGSFYTPLASEFKKHVQRTPETTDRFDYAANVVSQSLRPSPVAWFWYGKATSIIRFFDTFAWRTFWDYVFWREFKLGKMQKAHFATKRVE